MTRMKFKRTMALFVALCFALTQQSLPVVSAAPAQTPASPESFQSLDVEKLNLSRGLGKVEEIYKGAQNQTVILIQDAHAIPDAQKSIQRLIAHFQKKYGINFVGLEGASSYLDPQMFKSFPQQDVMREVFRGYLDKGELTAGTASAIFNSGDSDYAGLEDWTLYQDGLRYYLLAQKSQPELLQILEARDEAISVQKEAVYSPALKEADDALSNFRKEKKDLLSVLQVLAKTKKPAEGSRLRLILDEAAGGEDRDRANEAEVRKLAEIFDRPQITNRMPRTLYKEFQLKRQLFQTSQLSSSEFALYLSQLASALKIPVPVSDKLISSMQITKQLKNIEGAWFFREFREYVREVKDLLIENDSQRAIDFQTEERDLLERFARLQLDQPDWKNVRAWMRNPSQRTLDVPGEKFSFQYAFYLNAKKRDKVLFDRLIAAKSRNGESVGNSLMVAGGFHAEGLTQLFRQKGISYAVLMPEILELPDENHYEEQMKGGVSWKEHLKVENGKIDLYSAFVRGTRDKILEALRDSGLGEFKGRTLKAWRDQIIRDLSEQGRIAEASRYTRYIDEAVEQGDEDDATLAMIESVKKFISGMKDLDQSGRLTPQNVAGLLTPSMLIQAAPAAAAAPDDVLDQEFINFDAGFVPVEIQVSADGMAALETEIPEAIEEAEIPARAPDSTVLESGRSELRSSTAEIEVYLQANFEDIPFDAAGKLTALTRDTYGNEAVTTSLPAVRTEKGIIYDIQEGGHLIADGLEEGEGLATDQVITCCMISLKLDMADGTTRYAMAHHQEMRQDYGMRTLERDSEALAEDLEKIGEVRGASGVLFYSSQRSMDSKKFPRYLETAKKTLAAAVEKISDGKTSLVLQEITDEGSSRGGAAAVVTRDGVQIAHSYRAVRDKAEDKKLVSIPWSDVTASQTTLLELSARSELRVDAAAAARMEEVNRKLSNPDYTGLERGNFNNPRTASELLSGNVPVANYVSTNPQRQNFTLADFPGFTETGGQFVYLYRGVMNVTPEQAREAAHLSHMARFYVQGSDEEIAWTYGKEVPRDALSYEKSLGRQTMTDYAIRSLGASSKAPFLHTTIDPNVAANLVFNESAMIIYKIPVEWLTEREENRPVAAFSSNSESEVTFYYGLPSEFVAEVMTFTSDERFQIGDRTRKWMEKELEDNRSELRSAEQIPAGEGKSSLRIANTLEEAFALQSGTPEYKTALEAVHQVTDYAASVMGIPEIGARVKERVRIVWTESEGSSYASAGVDHDHIQLSMGKSAPEDSKKAEAAKTHYQSIGSEVGHSFHYAAGLVIDGKMNRGVAEAYDYLVNSLTRGLLEDDEILKRLEDEALIGSSFLAFIESDPRYLGKDPLDLAGQEKRDFMDAFFGYLESRIMKTGNLTDVQAVKDRFTSILVSTAIDAHYGLHHYVGAALLHELITKSGGDIRLAAKLMGLALKNTDKVRFDNPRHFMEDLQTLAGSHLAETQAAAAGKSFFGLVLSVLKQAWSKFLSDRLEARLSKEIRERVSSAALEKIRALAIQAGAFIRRGENQSRQIFEDMMHALGFDSRRKPVGASLAQGSLADLGARFDLKQQPVIFFRNESVVLDISQQITDLTKSFFEALNFFTPAERPQAVSRMKQLTQGLRDRISGFFNQIKEAFAARKASMVSRILRDAQSLRDKFGPPAAVPVVEEKKESSEPVEKLLAHETLKPADAAALSLVALRFADRGRVGHLKKYLPSIRTAIEKSEAAQQALDAGKSSRLIFARTVLEFLEAVDRGDLEQIGKLGKRLSSARGIADRKRFEASLARNTLLGVMAYARNQGFVSSSYFPELLEAGKMPLMTAANILQKMQAISMDSEKWQALEVDMRGLTANPAFEWQARILALNALKALKPSEEVPGDESKRSELRTIESDGSMKSLEAFERIRNSRNLYGHEVLLRNFKGILEMTDAQQSKNLARLDLELSNIYGRFKPGIPQPEQAAAVQDFIAKLRDMENELKSLQLDGLENVLGFPSWDWNREREYFSGRLASFRKYIETGDFFSEPETVTDVAAVLRTAVGHWKSTEAEKIQVTDLETLTGTVTAKVDADHLLATISNIISNAFRALKSSRAKKTSDYVPQFKVKLEETAGNVIITLTDNGPGFPVDSSNQAPLLVPDESGKAKIFSKGESASGSTGLGLWISHNTVVNAKGSIRAEFADAADPSLGARFVITLPRSELRSIDDEDDDAFDPDDTALFTPALEKTLDDVEAIADILGGNLGRKVSEIAVNRIDEAFVPRTEIHAAILAAGDVDLKEAGDAAAVRALLVQKLKDLMLGTDSSVGLQAVYQELNSRRETLTPSERVLLHVLNHVIPSDPVTNEKPGPEVTATDLFESNLKVYVEGIKGIVFSLLGISQGLRSVSDQVQREACLVCPHSTSIFNRLANDFVMKDLGYDASISTVEAIVGTGEEYGRGGKPAQHLWTEIVLADGTRFYVSLVDSQFPGFGFTKDAFGRTAAKINVFRFDTPEERQSILRDRGITLSQIKVDTPFLYEKLGNLKKLYDKLADIVRTRATEDEIDADNTRAVADFKYFQFVTLLSVASLFSRSAVPEEQIRISFSILERAAEYYGKNKKSMDYEFDRKEKVDPILLQIALMQKRLDLDSVRFPIVSSTSVQRILEAFGANGIPSHLGQVIRDLEDLERQQEASVEQAFQMLVAAEQLTGEALKNPDSAEALNELANFTAAGDEQTQLVNYLLISGGHPEADVQKIMAVLSGTRSELRAGIDAEKISFDGDFLARTENGKAMAGIFSTTNAVFETVKNIFGFDLQPSDVVSLKIGYFTNARQKEIYKAALTYRDQGAEKKLEFLIYAPARQAEHLGEERGLRAISAISADVPRFGGVYVTQSVPQIAGERPLRVPLVTAELVPGKSLFSQELELSDTEKAYYQRQAVKMFFNVYKNSEGRLFVSDIGLGQIVLDKREDRSWSMKIVDLGMTLGAAQGSRISPAQILEEFSGVFNRAISGMEESNWYWSSRQDKSGFFDGIIDALGLEQGRLFIEEAATASVYARKYLSEQIQNYQPLSAQAPLPGERAPDYPPLVLANAPQAPENFEAATLALLDSALRSWLLTQISELSQYFLMSGKTAAAYQNLRESGLAHEGALEFLWQAAHDYIKKQKQAAVTGGFMTLTLSDFIERQTAKKTGKPSAVVRPAAAAVDYSPAFVELLKDPAWTPANFEAQTASADTPLVNYLKSLGFTITSDAVRKEMNAQFTKAYKAGRSELRLAETAVPAQTADSVPAIDPANEQAALDQLVTFLEQAGQTNFQIDISKHRELFEVVITGYRESPEKLEEKILARVFVRNTQAVEDLLQRLDQGETYSRKFAVGFVLPAGLEMDEVTKREFFRGYADGLTQGVSEVLFGGALPDELRRALERKQSEVSLRGGFKTNRPMTLMGEDQLKVPVAYMGDNAEGALDAYFPLILGGQATLSEIAKDKDNALLLGKLVARSQIHLANILEGESLKLTPERLKEVRGALIRALKLESQDADNFFVLNGSGFTLNVSFLNKLITDERAAQQVRASA